MTHRSKAAAAAAVMLLAAASANAQTQPQRVTIAPQPGYEAGALERLFLGDGWRMLWTTPVHVPILQPARVAGGLEFDKRGGGRQTYTAHFKQQDGAQAFVFRSVDKFPIPSLAPEFQGTLA